jgi:hypothetical protein
MYNWKWIFLAKWIAMKEKEWVSSNKNNKADESICNTSTSSQVSHNAKNSYSQKYLVQKYLKYCVDVPYIQYVTINLTS